jgi:hypothetical protein
MAHAIADEREKFGCVPAQAAEIGHTHEPDATLLNETPQFLVLWSMLSSRSRLSEVIEPKDMVLGPPESAGMPGLSALIVGAAGIGFDLLGGTLASVEDGIAFEMVRLYDR